MKVSDLAVIAAFGFIGLVTWWWVQKIKQSPAVVDQELQTMLADGQHVKEQGEALLAFVIDVAKNVEAGKETYSDKDLAKAQKLVDAMGGNALYFVSLMAGNLARAIALGINGQPTNISEELKAPTSAEAVLRLTTRV